jgi:Uma2 family endonuclease
VLVVPREVFERRLRRFDGGDLLLAVEVVSPGSERTDRVTKQSEYAEAGVPTYWLVRLQPDVSLTEHRLVDGAYVVVAEHTGPTTLDVAGVAVAVDLDALVR